MTLPSAFTHGCGPMNRHGAGAGFRGGVDGAWATSSPEHASAIVPTATSHVLR
jgi:hypothetical protein